MKEEIGNLYEWLNFIQPAYQLVALGTDVNSQFINPHFVMVTGASVSSGSSSRRISRGLYRLLCDGFPDSGTFIDVLSYLNVLHRKCTLDEIIEELC